MASRRNPNSTFEEREDEKQESAQGSLEECRYYLILARDLDYGDSRPLTSQLEEVSKLLERYYAALSTSES